MDFAMTSVATQHAPRRRYGMACTPCRRSKLKCLASNASVESCDRCLKTLKNCIYERDRRGRWRREQNRTRTTGSKQELSVTDTHDITKAASARIHTFLEDVSTRPLEGSRLETTHAEAHLPTLMGSGIHSFAVAGFIAHSEDTKRLSLVAALDPKRVAAAAVTYNESVPRNISGGLKRDDPIALGHLSRPSAQILFDGFFKHFNCLVGLLDPQLYTFEYSRERSSLLFTVILAISSGIFQPEAHTNIHDHAELLLGQVLLSCDSSVENIWAIICVYHWKDVQDTRGYTLLGFALRMAASADWNMTRRAFSPDKASGAGTNLSESQFRQKRDKERVWLTLGNIERISSYFIDRPASAITLPEEELVSRQWLSSSEWTYPVGDGNAVGGFELTCIARPVYVAMMKDRENHTCAPPLSTGPFRSFKQGMERFNVNLTEWGEYWVSKFQTFPDPDPFQTIMTYFFRDYMRLYFNSVLLHRILVGNMASSSSDIANTAQLCYSSALSVLQQTIEMGKMDILYFLWDAAHLMTAYAALMMPKLLKLLGADLETSIPEAIDVLDKVTTAHLIAAESLDSPNSSSKRSKGRSSVENAIAIQARLLSAILSRVKAFPDDYNSSLCAQASVSALSTSVPTWAGGHSPRSTYGAGSEAHLGLPGSRHRLSHDDSSITPVGEGPYQVFDNNSMDSRYMNLSLSSWDEPGIFLDP